MVPVRTSRCGCFTLVEMLAVIAVIAVLAALLIPTVTKARDKVRATQCTSNVRQIMMATAMYLEGNDEVFPPQYYALDALAYYPDRRHVIAEYGNYQCYIEPYAESLEVFCCPSTRQLAKNESFAYDYAANTLMDGQGSGRFNNHTINGIKQSASDWIYIADTNYEWIQVFAPWRIEARHMGRVTVGYLDGQAASLTAAEVNTGARGFGWPAWLGGVVTVP